MWRLVCAVLACVAAADASCFAEGEGRVVRGAPDLADGVVFNAAFYINTNPEVVQAGISENGAARDHWLNTGLAQGLQGCGNFHVKQYLERYPNLAAQFGSNYSAAVMHYLTEGRNQGLHGFLNNFQGRHTISDGHDLYISASDRMAGAVDSVVFKNIEFINAHDHGRELQMALTMSPNGECFNPTEAGSRDDNDSGNTTSVVQTLIASDLGLFSQVYPAYWLAPGDKEDGQDTGSNCRKGDPALNTQKVSDSLFSKLITIGCPGVGSDPCFTYSMSVNLQGDFPSYDTLRLEGPTGYHTGEFNTTRSLNPQTGEMVEFNETLPLIFSTWCLQHAFGIWAPPDQNNGVPPTYGSMHFLEGRSFADATQKWNVVWQQNAIPKENLPAELKYKVYICVGTQIEAAQCTTKLIKNYRS